MHGLVATYACDTKSLCTLPEPVPQLLSGVQLRFRVRTRSGVESLLERAALPISLPDRNWLKNLPRQIALYKVWQQLVQEWTIF